MVQISTHTTSISVSFLKLTVLVHGKAREVLAGVRAVESSHEVRTHGKALPGAVCVLPPAVAIQRPKGTISDLQRTADTGGEKWEIQDEDSTAATGAGPGCSVGRYAFMAFVIV